MRVPTSLDRREKTRFYVIGEDNELRILTGTFKAENGNVHVYKDNDKTVLVPEERVLAAEQVDKNKTLECPSCSMLHQYRTKAPLLCKACRHDLRDARLIKARKDFSEEVRRFKDGHAGLREVRPPETDMQGR